MSSPIQLFATRAGKGLVVFTESVTKDSTLAFMRQLKALNKGLESDTIFLRHGGSAKGKIGPFRRLLSGIGFFIRRCLKRFKTVDPQKASAAVSCLEEKAFVAAGGRYVQDVLGIDQKIVLDNWGKLLGVGTPEAQLKTKETEALITALIRGEHTDPVNPGVDFLRQYVEHFVGSRGLDLNVYSKTPTFSNVTVPNAVEQVTKLFEGLQARQSVQGRFDATKNKVLLDFLEKTPISPAFLPI